MALYDYSAASYNFNGNSNDVFGNNGTDTAVTYVAGKIGQAASFNGTTSTISAPAKAIPTFAGNGASYSMWVKPAAIANMSFFKKLGAGVPDNALFAVGGAGSLEILVGRDGSGSFSRSAPSIFTINTWVHLVINLSQAGFIEVYKNGVSVYGSATGLSLTASNNGFQWGLASFNGLIDQFDIFNKTLTAGEVTTLYNSGNGIDYPFLTTPYVTTNNGYLVSGSSLYFTSTINTLNVAGTYSYDYGTSSGSYTSSTTAVAATVTNAFQNVGSYLNTPLTLGTTYYFRAKLTVAGTDYFGAESSVTYNESIQILNPINTNGSSPVSYTVYPGVKKILFVWGVTSPSFNGVAMTAGNMSGSSSFYYLINPPIGTYNLTFTGSNPVVWVALNCRQSNPSGVNNPSYPGIPGGDYQLYGGNVGFNAAYFSILGSLAQRFMAIASGDIADPNATTLLTGSYQPGTFITSATGLANLNTVAGSTNYKSGSQGGVFYFFSLVTSLPSAFATTTAVTNLTNAAVTLNGTVDGRGYSTNTYAEYGTVSGTYTTQTSTVATGTGSTTYSGNATGLAANTTYYYRVVADNGNGITYGAELSFTTLPTPSVATTAASAVGLTSGTINGLVSNSNNASTYFFEYGTSSGVYTVTTSTQALPGSATAQNAAASLTGLTTAIPYYYRIKSIVNGTTYTGSELSFTPQALPLATTGDATALATSATINGTTNPNGLTTTALFQWGTTTALGTSTTSTAMGNGTVSNSLSANLTGLAINTTYYYRIAATNSLGTGYGAINSFKTSGLPYINVISPQKVNNWVFSADVNPNGAETTAYFEYGLTESFGNVSASSSLGSGLTFVNTSKEILNLATDTIYFFRVVAINSVGTTTSDTYSLDTGSTYQPFSPSITVKASLSNIITISNDLQYGQQTNLSRDSVNNVTVFLENSSYLNAGRYLVGSLGASNAEISTLVTTTAPTVAVPSQATFAAAFVNAHSRGEAVTYITFDQVEIYSASSFGGTYTLLATISIQVNSLTTFYHHTAGTSSTYYKARYKNSLTGDVSSFSFPAAPSSLSVYSAEYMVNNLKKTLGITDNTNNLDDTFWLQAVNEARQIADREIGTGQMKEWRQQFEYPIKMLAGTNYVTLPEDVDYSETNRAVLNARYSNNSVGASLPLNYIDKHAWNTATYQRRYTTVVTTAPSGSTSLVVSNSGDFPSAGTVQAQSENYSQAPISISYTGNDKNTNTLTGVTGITRDVTVNSQVWAYQTQAYPLNYTVFDGKLWFDSVVPLQLNGINVYIDYYSRLVDLNNLADIIPEHSRDIYKDYLRFAIKRKRDDSIGEDDPDYKRFLKAAVATYSNTYNGQQIRIV